MCSTGPLLMQRHTEESGVGLRWPLCSLRDLHPHPPHSHRQAEANHPASNQHPKHKLTIAVLFGEGVIYNKSHNLCLIKVSDY
jgi:hypothetical protein